MSIYNIKTVYILTLIIVLLSGTKILAVETTTLNKDFNVLNLILDINSNAKSSKIEKTLLTKPKKNTYIDKNKNDGLNDYLINIFCTEVNGKYIKAASGSGVFLSNPNENSGVILTNAHVARHLLDSNKKCVGRTNSPTATTHILALRYIPSFWLNKNNQYVIGDTDQNSTGEFDFAIIESNRIKPLKIDNSNIYNVFKTNPKIQISNYNQNIQLYNTYIYSYPAQQVLSKNINNPLFIKKDSVKITSVYSSPNQNIKDSLLDVTGSKFIDHGSSGGMVISQGQKNTLIGISGVLIKNEIPQTVRVITMKHVLSVIENDLINTDNKDQAKTFLKTINDILAKDEVDMYLIDIFKNINFTSILEKQTRETLIKLNIIK